MLLGMARVKAWSHVERAAWNPGRLHEEVSDGKPAVLGRGWPWVLSPGVCMTLLPPLSPAGGFQGLIFFGGGVFKSSYILSRGIRLPDSRRIRKASGVEWSGWEFTVSLPCLTATS